jgi:hypothetical protein
MSSFERNPVLPAPAPIVVFAYKRPDHLRTMIDSLRDNPLAGRSELRIYCDAPRNSEDEAGVAAVRRYASGIEGFAAVTPVFRDRNLGLARSIVSGVTDMLQSYERVIVLEDDLVLSPHFLQYMNDALGIYSSEDAVASIHGYTYPTKTALPETFFLRGADCWGWATWRRSWVHFEPDGSALLARLRAAHLTRRFDFDGTFGFTQMLVDQTEGRNDSWAIRWHASCFLKERLTLYPGRSLVHNGGFDSTGRHCDSTSQFDQSVSQSAIDVRRLPAIESDPARQAFVDFFRTIRAPWPTRLRSRVRRAVAARLMSRARPA